MFTRINSSFLKLYHKQIDARGLALFRIVYAVVLIFQIKDILYYQHLVFDNIPYIDTAGNNFGPIIWVWMFSAGFIMLGLFTRIATVISYICTVCITVALNTFLSHIILSFLEINFLLMFLPVSRVWSLDRVLLNRKGSNTCGRQQDTVSAMAYLLPVFLSVGLVYFESTFYKLTDVYWRAGLGSWAPASLSIATISRSTWIVNSEVLEKALGYLTLVFEVLFVFLMWSKKYRWICFIIGFGLHLGILFEFPIPLFACVMMSVYILVLPAGIFKYFDKIKAQKVSLPAEPASVAITTNNDKRFYRGLTIGSLKQKLIISFFYFTLILQTIISYNSNLVIEGRISAQFIETDLDDHLSAFSDAVCLYSTVLFGITRNHLFTSNYLKWHKEIVRISYCQADGKETDLPLTDKWGMPGCYARNANWGQWTFIVCNPRVDIAIRDKGLQSYTAFWAHRNNLDLTNARFKIYAKPLVFPLRWERDFLKKQVATQNWAEAGVITWKNNRCTITRFPGH